MSIDTGKKLLRIASYLCEAVFFLVSMLMGNGDGLINVLLYIPNVLSVLERRSGRSGRSRCRKLYVQFYMSGNPVRERNERIFQDTHATLATPLYEWELLDFSLQCFNAGVLLKWRPCYILKSFTKFNYEFFWREDRQNRSTNARQYNNNIKFWWSNNLTKEIVPILSSF